MYKLDFRIFAFKGWIVYPDKNSYGWRSLIEYASIQKRKIIIEIFT